MKIYIPSLIFYAALWCLVATYGSSVIATETHTSDVQDLLNECKDISLEAPLIKEPSPLEVWGRTWGIYFAYKLYEVRYVIGIALLCAACYHVTSSSPQDG